MLKETTVRRMIERRKRNFDNAVSVKTSLVDPNACGLVFHQHSRLNNNQRHKLVEPSSINLDKCVDKTITA